MIGKVLRGDRPAGLIYYLYGPGKNEEHTDPHIVAGWREPAELEPPIRPGGRRDFRPLNGLLQQTVAALGDRAPDRPVWHCVARAAPGDRLLSDQEWAQVAAGIMDRTGLAPRGQDDEAVRWVAIRHAADHVHIVATLARQDGGGRACRTTTTGCAKPASPSRTGSDCAGPRRETGPRPAADPRGDRESTAARTAGGSPDHPQAGGEHRRRISVRRGRVLRQLEQAGVVVRRRFSTRNPGQVTGYSVALPGDTAKTGEPVWYGGGKLAADLTLPKLRQRWADVEPQP